MKTIARIGLLTALVAAASAPAAASDFIVTKIADTADGVCDADCSLREAIIAANAQAGADRVVLGSGLTYTLTRGPADASGALVAGTGDLDVTDALTIDGHGSTIDAAGLDRVLDIEGAFSATINNLTITGGVAAGFLSLGGGVYIRIAAVVFNNSSVQNNSTAVESGLRDDGGGIAAVGSFNAATGVATVASLTLNNTTVSTNTGANGGGVICVLCQLTTANATVTGNASAAGDGAGLAVVGNASTASITGGALTSNTGAARGGAIALPVGTGSVGITRSRMLSNVATLGSGIFNNTATVSAANNWWGCNFGPGAGGAGCAIAADSVSGAATTTPYLVLQTGAAPATVNPSVVITFTADLRSNSAGADVSAGGTVQDGIIVTFAGTLGSFTQPTVPTSAGRAANVFTAGASAGSASLSATADNQTIASTLPIVLPQVGLDTPSLTFAATTNGSAFTTQTGTQAVHITQSGIGLVTWTATSSQPWLVVSPASGSGPATLNVSVQFASGLAASQTGAITLAFTGAANTAGPINVTLNTMPVQVAIDTPSLTFAATTNGSAFTTQTGTQAVHITQSGTGLVTWTATSSQPWLVVSPASGSGPATLNVSVQFASGLAASQTGAITLAFTGAANTAGPINVTLNTVPVQVAIDTPSLTFAATTNGSAFTTQTGAQAVHITQSGTGLVTWTATSSQPWLVVSPASGSGPATLNVSVQFASGLAASQTGAITLAFTGAANTAGPINVTLNTVPVQVAIDKTSLLFGATANSAAFLSQTGTQAVHITQSGVGPVTWTAMSNQPWLVVSPASGSGPATLNVSVQFASGLAASQTGAITLAFTGAANTAGPINVTLNTVPVQVAIDKTSLLFGATANSAAFLSQTGTQAVHITQSGVGPVTWTAMSNQPWLVVSPASGSGPATLNVSVQFVPDLAAVQTGSITLAFTGATNTGPIGVTLTTVSVPSAPFGFFDTPMDGATGISGSIAVTGWALDDVQVTSVAICRDPVLPESVMPDSRCNNQPKLFIGNGVFIDNARPDVQALHPDLPLSSRAGWGYLMLTNFLPNLGNGTFNLFAYASDVDGHTSLLGSKTITCNNSASTSPFGAIDTPAQGEVVSGPGYANFGWVLSPAPAFADPPDGGTVSVFVDGVNVGSPGLWTSREDLTALFPSAQYPGVNMALGVFGLDTTALTNGLHSIAWLVTGTNGAAAGVGSRFFTVSNSASIQAAQRATVSRLALSAASPTTDFVDGVPVDVSPITVRRGFDLDAPLQVYRAQDDAFVVQAEELDRLELHLGPAPDARVAGFMRTPAGLVPLPAGSQLDPSTGVFVWQPGAGFLGAYQFVFVRSTGGQAVTRQDIRIVLTQKRTRGRQ